MAMDGKKRWHDGEGWSNDWVAEEMTHDITKGRDLSFTTLYTTLSYFHDTLGTRFGYALSIVQFRTRR